MVMDLLGLTSLSRPL